jgi:Protein of unknown function (DUF3572)
LTFMPMKLKAPKPQPVDPEILALRALAFLASDDDRLARFLNLSGLDLSGVKALAGSKEGLGAVLDYLLGWEPLLLEFAAEAEIDPASVAAARRRLPGGDTGD